MDGALHWIILYPLDSVTGFLNTYPQDSDLSGGICYPPFELGPEGPKYVHLRSQNKDFNSALINLACIQSTLWWYM